MTGVTVEMDDDIHIDGYTDTIISHQTHEHAEASGSNGRNVRTRTLSDDDVVLVLTDDEDEHVLELSDGSDSGCNPVDVLSDGGSDSRSGHVNVLSGNSNEDDHIGMLRDDAGNDECEQVQNGATSCADSLAATDDALPDYSSRAEYRAMIGNRVDNPPGYRADGTPCDADDDSDPESDDDHEFRDDEYDRTYVGNGISKYHAIYEGRCPGCEIDKRMKKREREYQRVGCYGCVDFAILGLGDQCRDCRRPDVLGLRNTVDNEQDNSDNDGSSDDSDVEDPEDDVDDSDVEDPEDD
ncbi:hypothetical protein HDU85_005889, partial [Gaertneriomyces sp. JEL0708]